MDSHIITVIKTVIAILFWTILFALFIVLWQLSQFQNFKQYASGVVARQGGLTPTAISKIERESAEHYRGVFRLINNQGEKVASAISYNYIGGLPAQDTKIKPYGTPITYGIMATPTAFKDIPFLDGMFKNIRINSNPTTTSLNRNPGSIAEDDTDVVGDTSMLPQNETIILEKSLFSKTPSDFKLTKLLNITDSLVSAKQIYDNRDETVATLTPLDSDYLIKPLDTGSTTLTFELIVKNLVTNKVTTYTRTYVVVVV